MRAVALGGYDKNAQASTSGLASNAAHNDAEHDQSSNVNCSLGTSPRGMGPTDHERAAGARDMNAI